MRIVRLRLIGFKSFVEATDFLIEPGLTGIVGPNGCGKSNLLEALRWAMGATSAKAMRGEGMDDVIFAGADGRPARSHAEVTLTLENDQGRAPPPFHAEPVLEITRRIDRGEGSTYRINGAEVRARDVQLLFADASTGANSPALVRQGQISELIAARPQNRRRILEEAAGISGLHGRRHEAELRVRAAETNLERLADLARELESSLGRLRREARAAARYKKLGAEIRTLRAAVLHGRWLRAVEARREAATVCRDAEAANEVAVREAATASTRAIKAADRLAPLREEQLVAVAVCRKLGLEIDRLERAKTDIEAEIDRLRKQIERAAADFARERDDGAEAALAADGACERLTALEADMTLAPARLPGLDAAWRQADAERTAAEALADVAAADLASVKAQATTARERMLAAERRLAGLDVELARAETEAKRLGQGPHATFAAAGKEAERAEVAAANLARELEAAEAARPALQAEEARARSGARVAEEALAEATVERRALGRLDTASPSAGPDSLLEAIEVGQGLEAALAAALGDDLAVSLDPRAATFWSETVAPRAGPAWPEGVRPLTGLMVGPERLSGRLSFIGLVAQEDGDALSTALPPGARLVSREGGLWRWDGLVQRPGAPPPAAVRLRQKARMAELAADVDRLTPLVAQTKAYHVQAAAASAMADQTARTLHAEAASLSQRSAAVRARFETLRQKARMAELAADVDRLTPLVAQTKAYHVQAAAASDELDTLRGALTDVDHAPVEATLRGLRDGASRARDEAAHARSAFEAAAREAEARGRRLAELRAEEAAWRARADRSTGRLSALESERLAAEAALVVALDKPKDIHRELERRLDDSTLADQRRAKADDALFAAERERLETERLAQAAAAAASSAREARASAAARLEATADRVAETAAAVFEATESTPAAVGASLAEEAVAIPPEAAGVEAHLAQLEREQMALGGVNLLAEEEAESVAERLRTMFEERDDLTGALARLRQGIAELNAEGRERLNAAFVVIDGYFRELFTALFQGGAAELRLVESEDPLEAGLEIFACPPGKRMAVMSLMSGGEQALTAVALIFAVFLANPAPICVLDEVDAPLDDANVERFCNLLEEMRRRATTRFITITHNPLTMSRMDRLFGVTMRERGVSQLVSVDLSAATALAEPV